MRLKKMFAGLMAAAMMMCAVSVPAFAAESIDEENCFAKYVVMNIPYSEFYAAAGVDSAAQIDAVTSATKSKTRAGNLASGSYHVNSDGSDITGVSFPVKVLTPWALKNCKQVTDADSYDITVKLRGKEVTTTYAGVDALFENETYAYYELSETPDYYAVAWYNVFSGEWNFTGIKGADVQTVEGVTVETTLNGRHTDYEFVLSGFELADGADVYGVVATTDDGAEYGLHHVTNIWRVTELGFDMEETYLTSMIGKTITNVTYYTTAGVYSIPVSIAVPALS